MSCERKIKEHMYPVVVATPASEPPGREEAAPRSKWVTKDSGERVSFESGMVRDTEIDKIDYMRVFDGPMLERWAALLTRGAVKYPNLPDGRPNWMLANGQSELGRFRRSATRHFVKWILGRTDEDHAAAVFFNINGAEYVKDYLKTLHSS